MSLLLEYSRISPESKRLAPELGLSWRWRGGLARTSQPHKGRRRGGGGAKAKAARMRLFIYGFVHP